MEIQREERMELFTEVAPALTGPSVPLSEPGTHYLQNPSSSAETGSLSRADEPEITHVRSPCVQADCERTPHAYKERLARSHSLILDITAC